MKRNWFISYRAPEHEVTFIGPVSGSRETARRIDHLLKKINPELELKVLQEHEAIVNIPWEPIKMLTGMKVDFENLLGFAKKAADSDKSLVQIHRAEVVRISKLLQEVNSLLASLGEKH